MQRHTPKDYLHERDVPAGSGNIAASDPQVIRRPAENHSWVKVARPATYYRAYVLSNLEKSGEKGNSMRRTEVEHEP